MKSFQLQKTEAFGFHIFYCICSEILFKLWKAKLVLAIIIEWQYITYFFTLLTYIKITKAFLVELSRL
jgi:hypothetical protein